MKRPVHRAVAVAVATLAAVTLPSCGIYDSKVNAERVAENYYSDVLSSRPESALRLYANSFFATTPKQKLLDLFKEVYLRCGTPLSHKLVSWQAHTDLSMALSAATLVYDVRYTSCETRETLVLAEQSQGVWKIMAQYFRLLSSPPILSQPGATSI
jgi:hypothetical protein